VHRIAHEPVTQANGRSLRRATDLDLLVVATCLKSRHSFLYGGKQALLRVSRKGGESSTARLTQRIGPCATSEGSWYNVRLVP
jgi:hypothetical protein